MSKNTSKCNLDSKMIISGKATCMDFGQALKWFLHVLEHVSVSAMRTGYWSVCVSPVVEVTDSTSLSALPPRCTMHGQLSQHPHIMYVEYSEE